MLIKDFDRIQCLCLDKRWKNWAHIEQEFATRGGKVERFIVGKGKVFPKNRYDHIDSREVIPTWHPMFTNNASHCYVCHRKILEKAHEDKVNNILLLEDDLVIQPNFDEVVAKATQQIEEAQLPWDMLYYGAINRWANTERISENLIKMKFGGYCWHATAINQSLRDNIKDLLSLPPIGPFDVLSAFFFQPQHEVYAVWPPVVYQRPGHSFVCETYLDQTESFQFTGIEDYTFKKDWYGH